jgi:hypothetical protein
MKKYLLLRDNKESGPWTIEELKDRELRPLDLVWKENFSTAWAYVTEVDELKEWVKEVPVSPTQSHPAEKSRTVFVSLPPNFSTREPDRSVSSSALPVHDSVPVMETLPFEELRERNNAHLETREVFQKRPTPLTSFVNVAAVFLGLILGAVLIKKMVDANSTVPESDTEVAAQVITEDPLPPAKDVHTALATELVPAPESEPEEKAAPPVVSAKPKDIKRQVKLSANAYKVGLFGGISDLKLTVYNGSPHYVEKIVVALDYLKQNGELIETREQVFNSMKPYGTKTLTIPQNNRGKKVHYRVLSIYSREYKAALRQV